MTARIFRVRPLRWVGQISYGAYVFHDILHDEFSQVVVSLHIPHATAATAALALAFTLFAAWTSFRLFEMQFIRLKDRWTRRAVLDSDLREANASYS